MTTLHVHKVTPDDPYSRWLWHTPRYVIVNDAGEWALKSDGTFLAYRSRSSAYSWINRDHRHDTDYATPVAL